MSYETRMIGTSELRRRDGGYGLTLRLPWYRSLPLSSLLRLEIEVDGRRVPDEDLRIEVNGRSLTVAEFEPLWQEFWYVQDAAEAVLPDSAVHIQPGAAVRARITADFRIPYILVAPETPLEVNVLAERTIELQEAAA